MTLDAQSPTFSCNSEPMDDSRVAVSQMVTVHTRTSSYRLSAYIRHPFVVCHVLPCSVLGGLSSVRDTLVLHRFLTGSHRWSSRRLAEVGK